MLSKLLMCVWTSFFISKNLARSQKFKCFQNPKNGFDFNKINNILI